MNRENMNEENKKETVCAVVVTYNRKNLLLECLEAIRRQTRPVDGIYIIDNASDDGTPELLKENGYIPELPPFNLSEPYEIEHKISNLVDGNHINVFYVRMHKNTGGAGGFYEGVKRGYERGYDWLWLMDDDGFPESNCLEILLSKKEYGHFIAPLVIRIDKKDELSFVLGKNLMTIEECKKVAINDIIFNVANPFNGVLISKELIRKIGFPRKEMFIWGDEEEYFLRAVKSKMGVLTVVNALHYHPKGKVQEVKIIGTKYKAIYQNNDNLRNYCFMRNHAFIYYRYNKKALLKFLIKYSIFFISRFDFAGYLFYLSAVKDGILGIWGKENK
jgi:rhamnopyranosyl-N-acetylglucosaminyl-diphospho-decaprenol beta-1,3/1,4-galactofuranosyltransferase